MSIFDQTPIETAFCNPIRTGGASSNVWPNRPRSTQSDLEDFVVARVSGPIRALTGGYYLGECTVSIALFARNVSNMKNSKKLSIMQGKVETALAGTLENITIKPFSIRVLGDTDDENGYHFRLMNLQAYITNIPSNKNT